MTKKQIYAKYGITYKNGKILSPVGFICELLKDGNTKTGEEVYTWSVLPGTEEYEILINDKIISVKGTCVCDCKGCYAKTGFYRTNSTKQSIGLNTYLTDKYLEFVENAISAQLEILERGEIRIHAAGDFNTENPEEYANMWHRIAENFNSFRFWTYTKIRKFESLFDDLKNANIVKSIIPHIGVNFGTCEYIINAYYTLKAMGIKAYICKCGVDKNQHCRSCGVCATYKFVLFLEHSTKYNPLEDPLFGKFCEIVNNQ